jgi:hypothetical protein
MNPDDLESMRLLFNSEPVNDFHGLSANEMNNILYHSYSEKSVVRLRDEIPDAVLDQIPIFRIAEALIKLVEREEFLKLTGKKMLNLKSCAEIYDLGFYANWPVDAGFHKQVHEGKWSILYSARLALQFAGLLKAGKGILTLSAVGKKRLSAMSRAQLFHEFFLSYAKTLNWAVNDYYPEWFMLQQLSGFPPYLLSLYGKDYQPSKFYFNHLTTAFPRLFESLLMMDDEADPLQVENCFELRFFDRFCIWFGLVETESKEQFLFRSNHKYRTTPVFDAVLEFDEV